MSVETWADAACQGQYHQSAEHQRAIGTIQSVLEGNLESDSAAGTIASTYEPLLKHGFKTSPIATLWGMICDVARSQGATEKLERGKSPCSITSRSYRTFWTEKARPLLPRGRTLVCIGEICRSSQ